MRVGDVPVRVEHLTDAQVATRLARRQRAFDQPEAAPWRATSELLLWSLGEELYATPLADIRGVAPLPRVTRVPGAPPALAGIVAVRGVIFNLFDPGVALGSSAAQGGDRMILLRHDRPCIALRASGAERLISLEVAEAESDTLTRFVAPPDERGFALVSTALLIERLLARRTATEG